jgi:hypothetical protein
VVDLVAGLVVVVASVVEADRAVVDLAAGVADLVEAARHAEALHAEQAPAAFSRNVPAGAADLVEAVDLAAVDGRAGAVDFLAVVDFPEEAAVASAVGDRAADFPVAVDLVAAAAADVAAPAVADSVASARLSTCPV